MIFNYTQYLGLLAKSPILQRQLKKWGYEHEGSEVIKKKDEKDKDKKLFYFFVCSEIQF